MTARRRSAVGTGIGAIAAASLALGVAACGGDGGDAQADAKVASGACGGARSGAKVALDTCLFLLSDGRQFSCRIVEGDRTFVGRMPDKSRLVPATSNNKPAGCARAAPARRSVKVGAWGCRGW